VALLLGLLVLLLPLLLVLLVLLLPAPLVPVAARRLGLPSWRALLAGVHRAARCRAMPVMVMADPGCLCLPDGAACIAGP
jgi:hypothetical protein